MIVLRKTARRGRRCDRLRGRRRRRRRRRRSRSSGDREARVLTVSPPSLIQSNETTLARQSISQTPTKQRGACEREGRTRTAPSLQVRTEEKMAAPRSAGRALLLLASRAEPAGSCVAPNGAAWRGGGFRSASAGAAAAATTATAASAAPKPLLLPPPLLRHHHQQQARRPFSSGPGTGGGGTGAGVGAPSAGAGTTGAAAAPAAAAAGASAARAAAAAPAFPRPPPMPKFRSADQLSPEELHAALPSVLFTTSNLILSS